MNLLTTFLAKRILIRGMTKTQTAIFWTFLIVAALATAVDEFL